jgi:hypothetical protein
VTRAASSAYNSCHFPISPPASPCGLVKARICGLSRTLHTADYRAASLAVYKRDLNDAFTYVAPNAYSRKVIQSPLTRWAALGRQVLGPRTGPNGNSAARRRRFCWDQARLARRRHSRNGLPPQRVVLLLLRPRIRSQFERVHGVDGSRPTMARRGRLTEAAEYDLQSN